MVPILVNKVVVKYIGIPEQYQPGQPQPAITYESTQLITDYISQLKAEKVYLNIDDTGAVTKPSDYLYKSSAVCTVYEVEAKTTDQVVAECCSGQTVQAPKSWKKKYIEKWYPVTFVSEPERWTWITSSLRKPTMEFPIGVFLGNDKIQFYPQNIKNAVLFYIRYPKKPVWNYTIDPNVGVPVYTPNNSQDIELPEVLADEMAVTILERLGIVIREPGLVDWSRYVKNSGK